MRPFTFAITSFLLSVSSVVFAQDTPFNKDNDNYPFKTEISNATLNGFTIEYKNYYKIVTNTLSNKRYCLVGFNQTSLPEGCVSESTIQVPVKKFAIDPDSYAVVPFIELLGLQNSITKTATGDITSPCIQEASIDTTTASPEMVFSSNHNGAMYVSFSATDDALTPLQKASWLLYIGTFFDLEIKASAVYNQITTNYNCHRANLGEILSPKPIAFTDYQTSTQAYTVHSQAYYNQLAADAGGRLVATNVAQSDTFNAKNPTEQMSLAIALRGAEIIVDLSLPNLTYDAWFAGDKQYFVGGNGGIQPVAAVNNDKVYTLNGLIDTNNNSDWTQRSAARPDLALLDLIKIIYPLFKVASDAMFPVWLQPFSKVNETQQVITSDMYGGCVDIATTAFAQSQCTLGQAGGAVIKSDLSTGDKAGISVGAIMFVLIAAVLAIWLFRRYRRQKRHNFYRMHDLQ